jgi:hypothetical protein
MARCLGIAPASQLFFQQRKSPNGGAATFVGGDNHFASGRLCICRIVSAVRDPVVLEFVRIWIYERGQPRQDGLGNASDQLERHDRVDHSGSSRYSLL